MKTILHAYHYNIANTTDRDAYEALCDRMREQGTQVFRALSPDSYYLPKLAGDIELETKHLFSDQWNTPTHRVFDWAENIVPNKDIRQGHYLDQTEEMRAIRDNTATCGYCGHQEPVGQNQFCPKCIGSEYLKPTELHLLRMLPVSAGSFPTRAPLSAEESRKLTPRYELAQGLGKRARDTAQLSKRRQRIANLVREAEKKGTALVRNAEVEADAFTWLMDHHYRDIDNVIYYPHTQKFGFGWRTPLTDAEVSALLDIITEFPYLYEIKAADGRKLTRDA